MKEKKLLQPRVSLKQKTALMLLGVVLFFVFLEGGLRLGGFVLLSIQEHRNLQSIKQKGTYRILCLGESTTQNQYPAYLEKTLNKHNIGVRFSVIDKGMSGTRTPAILSRVESFLNEYHPDAVVTMMGINDERIKYYQDIPESDSWLFRHCRVYRFGRIIGMHILKKMKKEGLYGLSGLDSGRKAKLEDTGIGFKEAPPESISIEYSNEFNPKSDNAYLELGWIYRNQGKFSQAEDSFKKALELNPKNDKTYIELGWIYRNQDKFPQAEDAFKKALKLNPKNDNVYAKLGWLYRDQGKFPQAENAFKKAVSLNPKNDNAHFGLGQLYQDQGKFLQTEDAFKKAVSLNPKNDNVYAKLGWLYRDQGKFLQAENAFKKAIELNPQKDLAYGALSILFEEIGKPELAKKYAEKVNATRLEYYSSIAINSFHKLEAILNKKKIKLVCVQYPMRNVESLKKMFEKDENIVFVDNEKIFKDAVRKDGYNMYFVDMFGGDFGHCTEKGNKLLAENIANVILREVFHRQ